MQQQVKRLGETYEVVVGFGLLGWVTAKGERIRRHLVVAQAAVSFEGDTGTITVQPAAEGARLALEFDMLDPEQRPAPAEIQNCEIKLTGCEDDPWSRERLASPLRSWVNAMNDRGAYSPGDEPPATLSSLPSLTFAPALILRRRGRKSLVGLLKNIAHRLAQMTPAQIPFGVRRLCEIVGEEDAPELGENPKPELSGVAKGEIYFPLPSNEEQRRIVERLRRNRGVLVQGPPGTGKSQTIANLICHLLAEGQRILVTSQTPRALKVLQSKLPSEMQALCVTVLGNDETALKNMERSVLGINEQNTAWEPERQAADVAQLEKKLKTLRTSHREAESRLRDLRERESRQHFVADRHYSGTAGAIARRLEEEAAQFGWMPDAITETTPVPVSTEEFVFLVHSCTAISQARRLELRLSVPPLVGLPSAEEFASYAEQERAAHAACEHFHELRNSSAVQALVNMDEQTRTVLRTQVEHLASAITGARQNSSPWAGRALTDGLNSRSKAWAELLAISEEALAEVRSNLSAAVRREVLVPEQLNRSVVLGDATALLEHMERGGWLGFWVFRTRVVRQALYIIRDVRVNGRRCEQVALVRELVEHLTVERRA
ncbi:MAG: AAA domain-containing protein, partial [Opitutaceae bacterium]